VDERIRVAVIYGGRGSEHGVSVVSAGSVLAALDPARYDAVPIGITKTGDWVLTKADPRRLAITGRALPEVGTGAAVMLRGGGEAAELVTLDPAVGAGALGAVDVVFPVLHGPYGEDGTIQGLLEMVGAPYVGAGVFASAAGMDKDFANKLFAAAGMNVGPYQVLRAGAPVLAEDVAHLGLPVFVKPARAGSSIGITRVTRWADYPDAVALAFGHDSKVLVEAEIRGREIECGVLEDVDGRPIASLPAEIKVLRGHDWYDFEAKYLDDAADFDLPPDLPPEVIARIQAAACQAFTAIDCAGLARVDFFLTPDGTVVINEVNTMPGFTPISMYPRMWAASGVPYPQLLDRLIDAALRRAGR